MTRDELITECTDHNIVVRCSTPEARRALIDALLSINPDEYTGYLADDYRPASWPYMGLNTDKDGWCLWSGAGDATVITVEEFLAMTGFAPVEDNLCVTGLEDVL
nr:MAG TPA: hypothetical protein [Caudoviricetes sp.]